MKLTSSAFRENQKIPIRYSGEGENVSPPLAWSEVPRGCQSFVLLCDDLDAPSSTRDDPFVHWLVYNISPAVSHLSEGTRGADQGTNSFHKLGYSGPMPPVGHGTHHYVFTLYALNEELDVTPGLTRSEILGAMSGHVLEQTQIVGTYERIAARKTA